MYASRCNGRSPRTDVNLRTLSGARRAGGRLRVDFCRSSFVQPVIRIASARSFGPLRYGPLTPSRSKSDTNDTQASTGFCEGPAVGDSCRSFRSKRAVARTNPGVKSRSALFCGAASWTGLADERGTGGAPAGSHPAGRCRRLFAADGRNTPKIIHVGRRHGRRNIDMPCRFGGGRPYFICPGTVDGSIKIFRMKCEVAHIHGRAIKVPSSASFMYSKF
jgi:hypothetical protein